MCRGRSEYQILITTNEDEREKMGRSKAYLREQREKAIRKKKRISHILYGTDLYEGKDGKYDKCHIGCGCGLCKPTKRFRKPSFSDQKKSDIFLRDIDEFWKDGSGDGYFDRSGDRHRAAVL